MPDSVNQELGFSATKALQTLSDLDNVMDTFEKSIGRTVNALDAFNKKGGGTVSLLMKITTDGNKAADALGRVASKAAAAGGKGAAGGTATVPNLDNYIAQLQKMYSISEKSTGAQKRAFQSAITSAAEFAVKNKVSMKAVGDQAKNLDKNFTGVANKMANNLSRIDKAAKKHLGSAGQSVHKLTIGFQTMTRVVMTQAIVRALSTLRNLLKASVSDAVQFQRGIAEIGTIAPTDDLSDLAARVREVSDAFNVPLEAATKGYYQTISNQIGETTDEFDTFMKAAAKFSKISVTDIKSAVDLGSGTLNAFGKSAKDAEEVFSKFFVTIKQGRVVGQELAQGYGQIAPLAKALGVELEEANAALATITINGIAADKAFTQLRGIFNSFLKPTDEMTAAMRELGFANSEQLFQAHGIQEALRLVIGTTDGSIESISKLVPRVRGLTGAISVATDETEHFTETMEAQREALDELVARAYELVVETNAEKVTKEVNKLRNLMTTGFGESFLEATANVLGLVGGVDSLKAVLSVLGPRLPIIAAGVTSLATALGLIALKTKIAAAGISKLTWTLGKGFAAVAAIPLAAALGEGIGKAISASFNAEHRAYVKLMDDLRKARQKKAAAELSIERQKIKELERLISREFASVNKKYFKIADAAVGFNKSILDDTKFFSDGIIREAQRTARAYRNAFESMGKDVRASEERTADLRTKLDDRTFEQRIKKESDIHKVYALTKRATKAGTEAASSLSKALSKDDRAAASEEFKRAEAFAEQALQIAEGMEDLHLEARVLASIEKLIKKNIRAEEAYQKTIENSQIRMMKRAKVEERRVAILKEKQKELLEAFTLYDAKTGELLDFKTRGAKLKDAQKTLREFITLSTKGKPLDIGQMIGFASLSTEMSREMSDFRIKELKASAGALDGLSTQVQNSLNKFKATIPAIGLTEQITGIEITGPLSQAAAISKLSEETEILVTQKDALIEADAELITSQNELESSIKGIETASKGLGPDLAAGFATLEFVFSLGKKKTGINFIVGLTNALETLRGVSKGAAISDQELKGLLQTLQDFSKKQSAIRGALLAGRAGSVADAISATKKLIDARKEAANVRDTEAGGRNLDEINARLQVIDKLRTSLQQPATDATTMAIGTSNAAVATAAAVNPANLLANAWRSIAVSAQIAATASANLKSPAMATHGGATRYLASGGAARGMDQIPAMLSKDEFVVNAKSSRQFYSQLSAMNAGMKPVFRESGGSVTTIGDVSISVTEAKSSQATAREVMKAFRREQRRGSGRL